jgi:GNAT superfamily N-acetyltransferase
MSTESPGELNDRVYTDCGLSHLEFTEHEDGLIIDMIAVSPEDQGYGHFRCAVEEIAKWADATGTALYLSPHPQDAGTSLERLTAFYQSLGFVERRERDMIDFTNQQSMERLPQTKTRKLKAKLLR